MSDSFDPYFKWLGISPADQPPNAYQLLGVPKYVDDLEVIESAADRQMAHVKSQASGPHTKLTQQVLNKLATARSCLLDEKKKAQYDEHLRQQEAAENKRVAATGPTSDASGSGASSGTENDVRRTADDDRSETTSPEDPPRAKKRKELSLKTKLIGHVAAPLVGLFVAYLVLCWLAPSRDFLHLFSDGDAEAELGEDSDSSRRALARDNDDSDDSPARWPSVSRRHAAHVVRPEKKLPTIDEPDSAPEPTPHSTPDAEPEHVAPEPPDVAIAAPPVKRPFADLDEYVKLPGVYDRKPHTVGAIYIPAGQELQIQLTAAPLEDAPNRRIESEIADASGNASSLPSWIVYLISTVVTGSNDAQKLPIARFFLDDASLKFQWSSHAQSDLAGQLRNCMLTATVGDETCQLALREPQSLPPFELQMEETVSRVTFQIPDRPPEDRIFLDVLSKSRLGPLQNRHVLSAPVSLGDPLELQYPSATLTVRIVERGDELSVEMSGQYKVGEREYPFATDRIEKHVFGSQKALKDALADGRRCEAEAYQLSRQISSLSRRGFPNTPSGVIARKQRDQQLASLRGKASRNGKKIVSLKKRVPELQKALHELPGVVRLTNSLRDGGIIHYRVLLMLDDSEIELAVSREEPAISSGDVAATGEALAVIGDDPPASGDAQSGSGDQVAAAKDEPPASGDDLFQLSDDDGDATVPTARIPDIALRDMPRRVEVAIEKLEANPNDPRSNLLVGTYLCLDKYDWINGALFLTRCGDPKLASAVKKDRSGPTALDAQVELAEAWHDVATSDREKREFLIRSSYWYHKARRSASGLTRLKIEKRVKEIDAIVRKFRS